MRPATGPESLCTTIDYIVPHMASTSVRLPDDLLEALDRLADREHVDRSTMMRRAIERGLEDLALDQAVDAYQSGGVTAWKAAREHGVTLWDLLDELRDRGLGVRTDEEELRRQIEDLT